MSRLNVGTSYGVAMHNKPLVPTRARARGTAAALGGAMSLIDEPVSLSAYDPQWPLAAADEISRIVEVLRVPRPNIEHIGSTAVRGLIAKPILDVMLGVPSYPPSEPLQLAIEQLGYEGLGEAGVPRRLYFRKRDFPAANLHVVEHGGSHWEHNIAMREFLRKNIQARQRYADAKVRAITSGAVTLIAYSAAKSALIEELLAQATAPPNKSLERTRER